MNFMTLITSNFINDIVYHKQEKEDILNVFELQVYLDKDSSSDLIFYRILFEMKKNKSVLYLSEIDYDLNIESNILNFLNKSKSFSKIAKVEMGIYSSQNKHYYKYILSNEKLKRQTLKVIKNTGELKNGNYLITCQISFNIKSINLNYLSFSLITNINNLVLLNRNLIIKMRFAACIEEEIFKENESSLLTSWIKIFNENSIYSFDKKETLEIKNEEQKMDYFYSNVLKQMNNILENFEFECFVFDYEKIYFYDTNSCQFIYNEILDIDNNIEINKIKVSGMVKIYEYNNDFSNNFKKTCNQSTSIGLLKLTLMKNGSFINSIYNIKVNEIIDVIMNLSNNSFKKFWNIDIVSKLSPLDSIYEIKNRKMCIEIILNLDFDICEKCLVKSIKGLILIINEFLSNFLIEIKDDEEVSHLFQSNSEKKIIKEVSSELKYLSECLFKTNEIFKTDEDFYELLFKNTLI